MTKMILVVEDDAVARAGLSTILQANHYNVVAAANADEAIHLLNNGAEIHLVLLDMILRGSDGWSFFVARNKGTVSASVPVVVMTGLAIASDEWAKAMGAAALLRKPLDVPVLLDAVGRYCL